MSKQEGNDETVREEFRKQARGFSNKWLTLNSEYLLNWIHKSLSLHEGNRVLDVAAGTGILSRSIAPYVKQVVSMDLSSDMITEGINQNRAMNIANIEYYQAHAEQIPFQKETFDLVISRLAFHHFTNPNEVLQEMARVSTPSGTICVVDMIASEDETLCRLYNQYEKLRDPSHTYALKESEFAKLFTEAGLDIQIIETIDVPVHFTRWLELANTDDQIAARMMEDIKLELAEKKTITGLSLYMEQGEIMFNQKWIKIVGKK